MSTRVEALVEALRAMVRDDDTEPPMTDVPMGPFDGFTPEDAYSEGMDDAERTLSLKAREALAQWEGVEIVEGAVMTDESEPKRGHSVTFWPFEDGTLHRLKTPSILLLLPENET